MGTEPKQITRVLLLEQGLMITFAIVAGAAIGFGILRWLMPYVGRSIGSAFPPPILVFDWPSLAVSLSAIIAATAIGLIAALRALLHSSVTSVLRVRPNEQLGRGRRSELEAEMQRGAETLATFHEALVRFRHVFKVYRVADTGVVALGGVDFEVGEGEFLAVVGPSGSGKSTILNMIGGLDRATAGSVEVEGRDLGRLDEDELTAYRRDRVGFVWQGTARNLVPYLSVVENVRLPSTASGVKIPAARRTPARAARGGGARPSREPQAGAALGRRAATRRGRRRAREPAEDHPGRRAHGGARQRVLRDGARRVPSVNHEFGVTIVWSRTTCSRPSARTGSSACATGSCWSRADRWSRSAPTGGLTARRGGRRARGRGPGGRGSRRRGPDPAARAREG
jgi:hypothetical protein